MWTSKERDTYFENWSERRKLLLQWHVELELLRKGMSSASTNQREQTHDTVHRDCDGDGDGDGRVEMGELGAPAHKTVPAEVVRDDSDLRRGVG